MCLFPVSENFLFCCPPQKWFSLDSPRAEWQEANMIATDLTSYRIQQFDRLLFVSLSHNETHATRHLKVRIQAADIVLLNDGVDSFRVEIRLCNLRIDFGAESSDDNELVFGWHDILPPGWRLSFSL